MPKDGKMERKFGGVTLAIDGRPVRPMCSSCAVKVARAMRPALRAGGAAELKRARRTVEDARAVLDGTTGLRGIARKQEDAAAAKLAGFAAHAGLTLLALPFVVTCKWFRPEDEPDCHAFIRPAERDGLGRRVVWLGLHRKGEELVQSVLHELRHFAQADLQASGSEDDAEAFASRWAPAVWGAARYTDGATRKLHTTTYTRPPFGTQYKQGDVVLAVKLAEAWWYSPRGIHSWQRIG